MNGAPTPHSQMQVPGLYVYITNALTRNHMFDAKLIPETASAGLQEGYTVRPLQLEDYEKGILKVLTVLTEVGEISKPEFEELYEYWATASTNSKLAPRIFYPIVIESDERQIVAAGTLIVEQKLIHQRALAGHIEDISVDTNQQGKKLGKRIIDALTGIGKSVGCYKIILDCDEKNVGFYEKCGYSRAGVEMHIRT